MDQFGRYEYVNDNALTDDGGIQFATKQKATQIDSVFITFHPNDKSILYASNLLLTTSN
jgi:hypothetical protein